MTRDPTIDAIYSGGWYGMCYLKTVFRKTSPFLFFYHLLIHLLFSFSAKTDYRPQNKQIKDYAGEGAFEEEKEKEEETRDSKETGVER